MLHIDKIKIMFIQSGNPLTYPTTSSTTVPIKVLFLLATLLLLVLFSQNMFYAVYAKFNLHEIMLVHHPLWNGKPARMVEFHQMTSNSNESQRLRRIS